MARNCTEIRAFLLLALVGAALFMHFADAQPASAGVCKGQFSEGVTPAAPARAYYYYVDTTIDGDPSDSEYVFLFNSSWSVDDVGQLRWASSSGAVRNIIHSSWAGTLAGYTCSRPYMYYADYWAVRAAGGPENWKNSITITRR